MELALYSAGGYYERGTVIGKKGDFYTSVSVGPLFGELLARQFSVWLRETETLHLVEVGAHDGSLARDIIAWFTMHQPEVAQRLEYVIVEPSGERRAWQQRTLEEFRNRARWETCLPHEIRGVLFSNELLDAMPANRLRWSAELHKWGEWFVATDGIKLVWHAGTITPEAMACAPDVGGQLAEVLPDGFTVEVSPAAAKWWNEAARALQRGRLVAIDYGLTQPEWFRPDRSNGTARAYSKHRLADDLLANPGDQDITAHVNWTAIQRVGEEAGLRTEVFSSQEQFLMQIVKLCADDNWSAEQIRQLKTLTHPSFLGRSFRVLVQCRD